MSNTDSAAAAYIIDRVGQDISFLAYHGHISREDEASIRLLMSKASKAPLGQQQGRQAFHVPPMNMANPQSMPTPNTPNGNPYPRHIPPNSQPQAGSSSHPGEPPSATPSGKKPEFCKASWPYNADGSEPNDLSFRKGDIIEIVEETNTDWWTGITRGRTGLFPSNHATKIPYDPHLFPTPPESAMTPPTSQRAPPLGIEKSLFPPPMHGMPPGASMSSSPHGPQQVPVIMQPGVPETPKANSKLKKTGSQIGNAMVTGFGFGAGAAIAGDIVNSIL